MKATQAAIFGLLVSCSSVQAAIAADTTNTIVIGQTVPLTGSQAEKGKSAEQGAMLAIENLNAATPSVSRKTLVFRLMAEDDQADPRVGAQVAQRLVDEKVAAIVGPYVSGVFLAAAPIYGSAKIPVLTIATNPKVTEVGVKGVLRLDADDNLLGQQMAVFAVDHLAAKTAAVVDDRTAYGEGVADAFKKAAVSRNLKIVDEQYTTSSAVDFRAILTIIKQKKPDVIFYGGDVAQGAPFAKQMKELGIEAKLLGGDGICTPILGTVAEQASAAVYCSTGTVDISHTKAGQAFSSQYKARFGVEPQQYAVTFYDAVTIIGEVIKSVKPTDPVSLVKARRSQI
ncbi:MAG: branched-chain amino acid ABC transporter substrate-binding protein [Paraburkholderia sp.]|uniref:branched-chain amino acid ABC transporter substrate-binding protein n=1 Tax=Paraburkholderia sp. TaxID=1926495 RepID=UPI00397B4201